MITMANVIRMLSVYFVIANNNASSISGTISNNTFEFNRGEDRNGNGILEVSEDTDLDGELDPGIGVWITANASTINMRGLGEDINGNGVLDSEDRNGNGVLDPSEDKAFEVSSGSAALANCGVCVNSDSDEALSVTSGSVLTGSRSMTS